MSGNSQVRTTAVLCFLCVIALTVAFPVQAQAQPQAETPDAVVSPGESIQDAIETASPGETIQLNSGTYEQGIVIDKNLNIVASGDVTLNGAGVSAEDGIVVETTNVTIDGIEITQFSDDGIDVRGNNLDPRQIEIVNVTSRLNDGYNIVIFSSQAEDTVELTNVVSRNSNPNPNDDGGDDADGIEIAAETVTVEETTVIDSEDTGLEIFAGKEGTVNIQDSTFANNGVFADGDAFGEEFNEDGISIASAQDVSIKNTTVINSKENGIEILGSDAIAGGRTIELINVTSRLNGDVSGHNIEIFGTSDVDTVELTNVVSRNSNPNRDGGRDDDGIEIAAETVTVEETTVIDSEDTGLEIFAGKEGTVNIQDSTFANNGVVSSNDAFDEEFNEDGISIASAQDVSIKNTTVINSKENGIEILGSDAIAGGRTVNLTNVTARANGFDGAFISGTTDSDTVSIANSQFNQNDDDGLDVVVESVNIAQTNLTRNTLAGARFAGAFTGGTLTQSSIFNNGGPAIVNEVSGTSVDATNNWWGNPSGPGTNEIAGSGNVDATDPLPAPPDPDTDTGSGSGSGSGSTAITAQRTLNATEVTNGSTVTVTVEANFERSIDDAKVVDTVIGEGISAENLTITQSAGAVLPIVTSDPDPAADITWNSQLGAPLDSDSVTVEYELTIPEDTPVGTTITFDGTVTNDETSETAGIDGDSSVEVVATTTPDTVSVGGEDVPVEFTTTENGETTVTARNAIDVIDAFRNDNADVRTVLSVIDAFRSEQQQL